MSILCNFLIIYIQRLLSYFLSYVILSNIGEININLKSKSYSENFKEIKAWEVLKFWKEKIGILPIYFAWRQKLIVFTLCQVCTLYENSIT